MYLQNILEEKINDLIKKQKNQTKTTNSLDKIKNIEDFFNISNNDILYIIEALHTALNDKEFEFLITLQSLSITVKKNIINIGLEENQKIILYDILNKLKNYNDKINKEKNKNIENEINTIKKIIEKINNSISILDKEDIENLYRIINESNLSEKEKNKLFKDIALNNYNKSNNFNIENKQEEINCEELIEDEKLIELFNKYNLDFSIYNIKWREYLKQKGNLENIESILHYISIKPELKEITNPKKQEIFIKILVHSSVELIEKVINTAKANGIKEIIFTHLTILYPTIKERTHYNTSENNEQLTYTSGTANYFLENVELLKSLNLDIKEVYSTCSTLFTKNPKTIRKALKELELYDYSLFKYNKEYKEAISTLKLTDISTKIDSAIENNCYEYCKQNLSRLSTNLHRIKYAKKLHSQENFNPFIVYKKNTTRLALQSEYTKNHNKYGDSIEETFDLYEAANINVENYDLYEGIIDSSDNNNITEKSLEHPYIKALDNSIYYNENNKYEYKFNNIIISRFKVLRFLETLISIPDLEINKDTMLYIITKNSMLDQKELNIIKDIINNLNLTRSNKI